jgi:hypothetical protein
VRVTRAALYHTNAYPAAEVGVTLAALYHTNAYPAAEASVTVAALYHTNACGQGACGAKRGCNETENAEGGHGQAHRLLKPESRTLQHRCMEGEGHSARAIAH